MVSLVQKKIGQLKKKWLIKCQNCPVLIIIGYSLRRQFFVSPSLCDISIDKKCSVLMQNVLHL